MSPTALHTNGEVQNTLSPTKGVKRRRGEYINGGPELEGLDDVKSGEFKRRKAGTSPRSKATKATCGVDGYNARFMASMCFSAHATCRRTMNLPPHIPADAQLFKTVLTKIFTALEHGNTAQHVGNLGIVLKLLAVKDSTSRTKPTRDELNQDFNKIYTNITTHIREFSTLMPLPTPPCKPISLDTISKFHDLILSTHHTLQHASKWHTILPYTPLSLSTLHSLHTLIQRDHDIPTRPYYHLTHLLNELDDIRSWLSMPPSPRLVFPTSLRDTAVAAMEEENKRRADGLLSVVRPDGYVRILKEVGQKARVEKEEETRVKKEEEGRKKREKKVEWGEVMVRWLGEREEGRDVEEEAKRKMEEEVRAIAERQQEVERQQKAAKEQAAAAAAAAERRECERQQQVAQQQERDRQQQIAQNQERERQQQEAQQQHQAIQQQAEQRSNQEDATASADASPDEMRKKLQTWKTFLRNLMTASSHGQAPTIADFHRLEDVPTYDECLERLQSLWEALQEPLRTLDPQQLLAFPDQLLELETWLCMAQLLLVLLRIYNRDAKDVVRTGWKPAALVQAQKVLRPYANQLIHTDLLFVVDQVGALLDEGYRRAIRASMKGVVRSPAGGGFGLSMNNQMAAATEGGSKSATPPAPNRPYNPLLDPSRTALDKNGLPIPNPRIKPPSHNSFLYPASSLFDGLDKSHFQAPERTLPQSPTDNTQTEYYHPACPSFKIDTCTASPLCKAPHHACAHWLNGKCKYGGSCKQSHDPWFKAQIHGGGLEGSFEPACRFFKTGTCVKGDNCARPHEACPHFLRGRCKFGVMCMGSHDPFFMSTFAAVDTSDVQMESMMGSILDSSSRVGRERADAPSPSPSLFSAEDTDSTPADTAMGGRIKEACWFFKTGTCTRGDDCTRPHVACRGFLAGYCRFGDGCRFSHDPFFLIESNGAGDGGQEGVGEGVKMGKKAWMKSMMCRDGVGCGNRKCGFLHPAVGKD